MKLERRHSRWYELILFNGLFQFLLGFAVVVLLPNWIRWEDALLIWPLKPTQLNTLLANSSAYVFSFLILYKFKRYPGTRSLPFIIPTLLVAWLLVFAVFLFLREEAYARQVLFYSFMLANVWAFLSFFVGRRYLKPKLALVPFGRAVELGESVPLAFTLLDRPNLEGRRYDAVVADLHSEALPDDWEYFLASCTLAGIPVFHYQQVKESLTGRVQINHLSENILGSLQPSAFYSGVKRLVDIFAVLVTLPITLPIMLLTAIAVKLDSPGSVLFIQKRVGQGNKDFTIYKFRSMCKDSEASGAQLAQSNDMRVTRVGKVIRKTRLDEFPQFFNVLLGSMSLIGPRPEQRAFVERFEKEIPFYNYRHVIKPGITGWAQVEQGYAGNADDTRIKIEHDFYYIKHFSLWLDILIVVKTIRTILTGFGAR